MLMKKKNIHKKNLKKQLFFKNEEQCLGIWSMGSHNENLKEIHAITSEIIDATDGRTTDEFRFDNLC